jgi:alkylhydroperoxidase family enzyme
MDRRKFVRASVSAIAATAFDADPLLGTLASKSGATTDPLPLVSIDESARLGEKLGIERVYATSNVFRALLNSPSATAGFYGVLNALLFRNKVAARTRELIILRIGWRTGSEYVFCNHVRFSRELGIPDKEILGVRDPRRCYAYNETDRTVLHFADELHERAEVTRSTWAALEKAFGPDELVELLLIAGFWRMAAGFVKSAKIQLDAGVPSWPEGRKPDKSVAEQKCFFAHL